MARKKQAGELIVTKLRQIEVMQGQGKSIATVCKALHLVDHRGHKTQSALECLLGRDLSSNHGRAEPILGRLRGDRYFGGGGWCPTTLTAAGLHYRRASHEPQVGAAPIARRCRHGDGAR